MSDNKSKRRNALGRGLGALLDDAPASSHPEKLMPEVNPVNTINEIDLLNIEVNPFQPRTQFDEEALAELAESIKVQGIIQPITVRKLSERKYQLISGERRFHASKLAGLLRVPAYVRTANDQQMLEMALIENIQRENLNAMEIALSYQRLLSECELRQEDLGDRVGKKRSTVTNYLRLLKLPPDIQAAIRDGKLGMGHARALVNIENVDQQLDIFHRIVKDDLSVRKVEELAKNLKSPEAGQEDKATQAKPTLTYELKQMQDKLSSHFGSRVNIQNDQNNKGFIKIPYLSHEDLNRIIEILDV
ncbi:MAG: ParB/RepB/Spo0J family partition protein [Cyclobacteriaceae bacterium]|nr:ParB/RepB/Spo0J family partition protein [Cyclobacteriaceae bacterium]